MDDRTRIVALVLLGLVALGALAVVAVCVLRGADPPPVLAATLGASVGALAGLAPTASR